jgi:hypothetical protein
MCTTLFKILHAHKIHEIGLTQKIMLHCPSIIMRSIAYEGVGHRSLVRVGARNILFCETHHLIVYRVEEVLYINRPDCPRHQLLEITEH